MKDGTVHMLTAAGCGHCENAKAALGSHPGINVVQCHGPNAVDPTSAAGKMCQGVQGFPTFKKDNKECAAGFSSAADVKKKCGM